MTNRDLNEALLAFQDYVTEIAKTWYGWDEAKAFRHAAFRLLSPDRSRSDEQIVEITAIAAVRDLDVGGWALDEEGNAIFLIQTIGYNTKTDVDRIERFWEAPERVLASSRTEIPDKPAQELARVLQDGLRTGNALRMVFVSRGGFTNTASEFAWTRANTEKPLFLPTGGQVTCLTSLELVDEAQLAVSFTDGRAR